MVSLRGRIIPAVEPTVCFGAQMVLWAVCCAPSSCNSPTKGYLEQRMALLYSAIWNKYLGWVNCFPVSGIATGAEEQLLTRVSFTVVDFAFLSHA